MAAFASDLSGRFTGPAGNPVLAAHQLVAELAQIYYEQPNDDTPRAVVAVPPSTWSDDPSFVSALLGALAGNPIIQSVTTSELFATFPGAAACRTGCRLLSANGGGGLPANAIRTQRERINGFAAAAPTARSLIVPMGKLVLAGESALLRPAQQAAVLHNTGSAVDAQLAQLEVSSGQSITLTSQQGTLPIAIVSSAPYPVRATLTVTSDKLLFANGTTGWTQSTTVLPGHSHTNVVYVKVRARNLRRLHGGHHPELTGGRPAALERPDRGPVHRHLHRRDRPVARRRGRPGRVVGAHLAGAVAPTG